MTDAMEIHAASKSNSSATKNAEDFLSLDNIYMRASCPRREWSFSSEEKSTGMFMDRGTQTILFIPC